MKLLSSAYFSATASAVAVDGDGPVLVDVARITTSTSAGSKKDHLPTKAIIPVHLNGRPAGYGKDHGPGQEAINLVVEDARQSLGLRVPGKKGRSWAHWMLEFYP
jgi:dTDP-4-amino-4,6-dideoxygalactose transaminase